MHPILAKTFGGLNRQYYVRQLFFGMLMGGFIAFMVSRTPSAQGAALAITMGYVLVCTLLYPYARFVYEGIVGFIMGQNMFVVPALFMMVVKLISMFVCFAGAIFIAPVGLGYLYLRHTRDERAAVST